MRGAFWKVCGVWALLLVAVALGRPQLPLRAVFLDRYLPRDSILPATGDQLTLPATLTTTTGDEIPTLSAEGPTLFLVLAAGCPACKRGLAHFPEWIRGWEAAGLVPRTLLLPGSEEDTASFLAGLATDAHVVLDTSRVALSRLRARVTPSVVLVAADGSVVAAFSPDDEWPPTPEAISRAIQQQESSPPITS